jgi:hypothetical protein
MSKKFSLDTDEAILLEGECSFGPPGTKYMILTKKRIMFLEKMGFWGKYDSIYREIPLNDILECYTSLDPLAVAYASLRLRLKNGEERQIFFGGLFVNALERKNRIDRWVNAINNLLRK